MEWSAKKKASSAMECLPLKTKKYLIKYKTSFEKNYFMEVVQTENRLINSSLPSIPRERKK